LGGTGAGPWDQVGTDVFPDSTGWNVTIGAAAVVGTEKLRVVGDSSGLGGIRIESDPAAPSCFLEMNEGDAASVSSANEGRIIYSESNQRFEVSENGGAYVPLGGGSGWTDDGGVVRLTTAGDQVCIGIATPTASEKLRVVGGVQIDTTSTDPGFVVQSAPGGSNYIYVDAAGIPGMVFGNNVQEGGAGPIIRIDSQRVFFAAGTGHANPAQFGGVQPTGAAGQAGRDIEVFGGDGGNGLGGTAAAAGGYLDLHGGDGGLAAAVTPAGLGGTATLRGGDAGPLGGGGPGNLGGDALVHGGTGSGGVANGTVKIGSTTTSKIEIANGVDNPQTEFLGTGLVFTNNGAMAIGASSLSGTEVLRVVGPGGGSIAALFENGNVDFGTFARISATSGKAIFGATSPVGAEGLRVAGSVYFEGDIDFSGTGSRSIDIAQSADDTGGNTLSATAGDGGNFSAGPVGAGGQFIAEGGDGGTDASVAGTGGAGGTSNLRGGAGGSAPDGGGTGGAGGNVIAEGGAGGASGGTQGAGGGATLRGGSGAGGGTAFVQGGPGANPGDTGGNVFIDGGAGNGAADGSVNLGASNTSAVNIAGGGGVPISIGGAGDTVGFFGVGAAARPNITGALSLVTDANALAVMTSIISALTTLGLATDGTT
jgi:hypothetical protein